MDEGSDKVDEVGEMLVRRVDNMRPHGFGGGRSPASLIGPGGRPHGFCERGIIFLLLLLQPLGGCKGMYLLDCKSINHSNHDNEIGVPVFEPSSL